MNTNQLLDQINRLYSTNAINDNLVYKKDLERIQERVIDDTFRIAVVGEFSSGKSTFINAMIGSDLLTHAVNETTATITRIHNVKKDDARIGTCVIEYRDGKKITIYDMEKLYEYTTAQSSKDVADTILNVSIYVHFTEASYPIEIVDTPGLNGIADKHREITIEEVKKAHACIYLLSVKGITNSDVDFIRILQRYQGKFIFVQNFIDQLKQSEGDTVEKKIESDRKLIEETLHVEDIYFDYDICGISALKKLCSKDYKIQKLYSDDLALLTEDDRKRFVLESQFSDFEKLLSNLVVNEHYKEIVIASAAQALNTLIDRMLANVLTRQEINEELQKQDDKTKRIEKSQQIIAQIESGKDKCRKNLENFIISRDKENRQGLKEASNDRLKEIYNTVCEEIDKRIQSYDDLEGFELIENKSMPAFYGTKTANLINSDLIPKIDDQIAANLSHLYDEAAQKVMEYTPNFLGINEKIAIRIQKTKESFQMKDQSYRARINEYESERKERIKEGEKLNQGKARDRQNLAQVNADLDNAQKEKKDDMRKSQKDIESLGRKPDVERRTITRSTRVKRGGFLGGIADFFDGGKKVYYDDVEIDDSAQREWIKKHNEYTNRQQRKLEQHEQRISDLNAKKSTLESSIKMKETRSSKIQQEINDLKGRIKRENEIYENALKQNKREFCDSQKKKLKNSLENHLFDRTGNACTLEKLEQHIDKMSGTYLKLISEKIDRYYVASVNEQLETLKQFICENTQKLEEQYHSDADDIVLLKEIKYLLKENEG